MRKGGKAERKASTLLDRATTAIVFLFTTQYTDVIIGQRITALIPLVGLCTERLDETFTEFTSSATRDTDALLSSTVIGSWELARR